MKYKVGDKVKVKKHVRGGCGAENCIGFVSVMEKYIGKKFTIGRIRFWHYEIKEDKFGWMWSDCMLEPIAKRGRPKKVVAEPKQYTISTFLFDSVEDAVKQLEEFVKSGKLTPSTKILEAGKEIPFEVEVVQKVKVK